MPKLIGFSKEGQIHRYYIYIDDIPLIGHVAFGVVDRCTNVLQIRPTTICPYNCVYCSVDAGPFSRHRLSEYIVDGRHLVKWVKRVYEAKGGDVVEGLIDGVGEPPIHPDIVMIVRSLKEFLPRVAMESRGYTLTEDLVDRLAEAGLDRLNISIDTLNAEKGRYLQGVDWYDVDRVLRLVEYIVKETSIDVHLTPVWIPGVNDDDIERIVEWGLRVGVGKRFPPFGIQKYEVHRYGRKVPGVREASWEEFRRFLERLEQKYGVHLYYKNIDFGIRRTRCYPKRYSRGDEVYLKLIAPGWLRNEILGVDRDLEVVVTVVGIEWSPTLSGRYVKAKLIEVYDSIYIARTRG